MLSFPPMLLGIIAIWLELVHYMFKCFPFILCLLRTSLIKILVLHIASSKPSACLCQYISSMKIPWLVSCGLIGNLIYTSQALFLDTDIVLHKAQEIEAF